MPSNSTNLEIPFMSESQANKAGGVNFIASFLEAALTESIAIETSAATTPGDDVVIPFQDDNLLSSRLALRCVYMSLTAGATAAFNLIHPDNKHLFIVKNNTSHTATVKTAGGTGVAVPPAGTYICYCDGTNVVNIPLSVAAVKQVYDFHTVYYGAPVEDEVISSFYVSRDVTLPNNLAGSNGKVTVLPSSTCYLSILDDGVAIAQVNISELGNFAFADFFSPGPDYVIAAGSLLTVKMAGVTRGVEGINLALLGSIQVGQ